MGVPCGKSTGQPGGSSTNYRDNGGSPNARNDPNNNPIPQTDLATINPAVTELMARGQVMVNAGLLHMVTNNLNGILPDASLLTLREALARMAAAHDEIVQLQQTVVEKDNRIKELVDQNAQLTNDRAELQAENERLR